MVANNNKPSGIALVLLRLGNLLLLAVIVAVVLELAGLTQGRLRRLVDQYFPAAEDQAVALPVEPEPEIVTPDIADDGVLTPGIASEDHAAPVKSPLEKEYDDLVNKHRQQLRPPTVGKAYDIHLRNGQQISGVLLSAESASINVKLEHGTMSFPVHQLAMRSLRDFFPDRTAKLMALQELRANVEKRRDAEAAGAVAASTAAPVGGAEVAVPAPVPQRVSGKLGYEPLPAKSDPELLPVLKQFAQWLEMQHRRVGGKIADQVYAKRQNGRPVLYLQMNETFLQQNHNIQFQLLEGLWQFWGFRCQGSMLIGDPTDAHVVMLNAHGRIIGGSRENSSADLWFEENRKLLTAER